MLRRRMLTTEREKLMADLRGIDPGFDKRHPQVKRMVLLALDPTCGGAVIKDTSEGGRIVFPEDSVGRCEGRQRWLYKFGELRFDKPMVAQMVYDKFPWDLFEDIPEKQDRLKSMAYGKAIHSERRMPDASFDQDGGAAIRAVQREMAAPKGGYGRSKKRKRRR